MLKINSKVGKIVVEVFSSLRTVLSLNASKYEQKRWAKIDGYSLFYVLHLGMKKNCIKLDGVAYENLRHSVFGWDGYFL